MDGSARQYLLHLARDWLGVNLTAHNTRFESAVHRLEARCKPQFLTSHQTVGPVTWLQFRRLHKRTPKAGWKIHVASAVNEAALLVDEAVEKLAELPLSFKLCASLDSLAVLNSGFAGQTQVGKFLTIYCGDLDTLVEATKSLESAIADPTNATPEIVTEPYWLENRRIHFRYGALASDDVTFTKLGKPTSPIMMQNGAWAVDDRSLAQVPLDTLRTRLEIGIHERDWSDQIWHDRLNVLPLELLSRTAKSEVFLALDLSDVTTVVVKRAFRGAAGDWLGFDSIHRLGNEIRALQELRATGLAPQLIRSSTDGSAIAIEDIGSATVASLDRSERLRILPKIAEAIIRLRQTGWVHRDLKLANVMLDADTVRLIDWELAAPPHALEAPRGGTNGSIPPDQDRGVLGSNYDLAGVCAILFESLSDFNPAKLPFDQNHGRQLGLLGLLGDRDAVVLHRRLWKTRDSAALSGVAEHRWTEPKTPHLKSLSRNEARKLKEAAIESLNASLHYGDEELAGRLNWRNGHVHAQFHCFALNIGGAGVAIALLAARKVLGTTMFDRTISATIANFENIPKACQATGMFTGMSGAALAAAATYAQLKEPIAARLALDLWSCAFQNRSEDDPDLFSGLAGLALTGIWIQRALATAELQSRINALTTALIDKAAWLNGTPVWASSEAFDKSKVAYLGAAHGSLGIVHALSEVAALTQDRIIADNLRAFVTRAARGLVDSCVSGNAVSLPERVGGRERDRRGWCHGLGGALWVLLQLDTADQRIVSGIDKIAEGWMSSLPPVDNPTICHGAAGSLEVLRMLRFVRPTFSARCDLWIVHYLRMLRFFRLRQSGRVNWHSEQPSFVSPDLWVGAGGTAAQILLALNNSRWPILSRQAIAGI